MLHRKVFINYIAPCKEFAGSGFLILFDKGAEEAFERPVGRNE